MLSYSPPRYLFRRFAILRHVKSADKFIELGPGNLMLSQDLLTHFASGDCVDFASGVKDLHKQLPPDAQKRLNIIIGDFFKLKPTSQYDCALACEVMEHIEHETNFVKKIHDWVKPGGQIIISVPARMKYWTVHDEVVGHVKRYEKAELEKIFSRQNGFVNTQVLCYGFPFVNLLWLLRKQHGKLQARQKTGWTSEEQTKASGINQIPKAFNLLGFIANKYVFYPANLLSSLFNRFDLSEGYVLVCERK